jgi:hypothetical protein
VVLEFTGSTMERAGNGLHPGKGGRLEPLRETKRPRDLLRVPQSARGVSTEWRGGFRFGRPQTIRGSAQQKSTSPPPSSPAYFLYSWFNNFRTNQHQV